MYTVMIRVGNARKIKREIFENPDEAEVYFNKLCERRTDYPATVVMTESILVKKRFRIDKDWKGDRYVTNDDM
jgi:hypothetical protein